MILTVLFAAALAAQPNTATPQSAPAVRDKTGHDKNAHEKKTGRNTVPDPDLIGFLGDYEDAADGLDPIGLSEQTNGDKHAVANEKKKDGHEP